MFHSERPKKNPLGGKETRWSYQQVEKGKSVFGWLAGPPTGVYTHHAGATKPCRRLMTNGKLTCPYCESKYVPVWRGYTPFYDTEYTRRFVLISEDYEESVSEIPHLAMIALSRGKGPRDPVVIKPNMWRTTPLPDNSERAKPVDLRLFLLRLWKDVELQQWSLGQTPALPRTVAEIADFHPNTATPENRIAGLVALGEQIIVKDADGRRTVNEEFVKQAKAKQNGNGKHKPPG